ncbi:MAG: PilZ domain-containing protein [Treponema sp.]|nr:PilZ domain-containing protein [Treponema sp.]
MKLLLVLGSDKTFMDLELFLSPLGFSLIRYRHVQKAMDNIDEIDPLGIIISAKDFPRHWKTMVRFVRFERSMDQCPIIILTGSAFPEEEIEKAKTLEVNGLMLESLEKSAEKELIQTILTHTVPKKTGPGPVPETLNRFGFVFSHPADKKLITGTIKTVSDAGISFEPDHPEMLFGLLCGMEINTCSLRAGENILSPVCTVRQTGKIITLEFFSFPGAEKETLMSCLKNQPRKEFKADQRAAS